ncbi:Tigger transposable element-derived protein 6 [Dictyocoela muelleri]|nr:Tigger transposable element-derived protein 6 [Dictyocoela muelleri]
MTSFEFNSWLYDWNLELKTKKRKILLILDNCPGHKITCSTSNIELLFLPKNSTSKLQPLDAGIIRSFKVKFYSYQLKSIVGKITNDVNIEKLFKELTIRDAIIYSKYAWDDVPEETIRQFCQDILKTKSLFTASKQPHSTLEETELDLKIECLDEVSKHVCLGDIVNEDEFLNFKPEFINFDFIKCKSSNRDRTDIEENDMNSTDSESEIKDVSYSEAVIALKTLKNYLFKKENFDQEIFESLKEIEKKIHSKKILVINLLLIGLIKNKKNSLIFLPPPFFCQILINPHFWHIIEV